MKIIDSELFPFGPIFLSELRAVELTVSNYFADCVVRLIGAPFRRDLSRLGIYSAADCNIVTARLTDM